ncbi:ATPase, T2SS/T4P/T4SS family [Curtobacterium sp. MCBD17_040]|uniref:GspE/PulE family protein n=1 Tax=Curtobacterium sp. MCBD17_040 TaxID=2175674 RepID=UPI0011B3F7AA|nr:ATPase, T2SS/T4P/T4SS family [Curtobacterium sp. MCBD17_040]WIB65643.1 ATPase, T2SS/T4P/T4SS family [Curtobacterium sp. MCBD17_040]
MESLFEDPAPVASVAPSDWIAVAPAAPVVPAPPVTPAAAPTFDWTPTPPAPAPAPAPAEAPVAAQPVQDAVPAILPAAAPQYIAPPAIPRLEQQQQQYVVPPAIQPAVPAPAPAVAPAPAPAVAATPVPAPAPAPVVAPAPAPQRFAVPEPEPVFDLPGGFFDEDDAAPSVLPAPLPEQLADALQAPLPTPAPVSAPVPSQAPPAASPVAVSSRPAVSPVPRVAAVVPAEPNRSNRLVVAPAPAGQRIPLDAIGQNMAVNDQWLDSVFRQLTALGVSDVHLTKSGARDELTIEGRRDGVLEPVITLRGRDAATVMNLIKSRSRISTGSNLVPDDGRYELEIDNYPYRIRAVSLPLFDGGEKVVLRLPQTGELKRLDQLGFTEKNLAAVRDLLSTPGGMIIIAGPMGEGKTTTAHAALLEIGGSGRAVTSVEDPVERVLNRVAQIEVNEDIEAGFGTIMRYLVRADFDTLFIGEIRDDLTAAAAVRLARAGRRVISTIHATDNVAALLQLIKLSKDTPLSVLDAVRGVISQRLVRRVGDGPDGYLGRHPVHETLTVTTALADEIIEGRSTTDIRRATKESSTLFAENARELVSAGVTDEAEIRRVLGNVL